MTFKHLVPAAALAAVLLTVSPALAQQGPVAETPSPAVDEQAAAVMTALTERFGAMLSDMGLEAPGVSLGLTPEMVAAAFPSSVGGEGGDVRFGFEFKVVNEANATAPPPNPEDFVVLTDAQGCTPAGRGEVLSFRTMARENAVGHQCAVVMEDGRGLWAFSSRSLAVAGDVSVAFIYYLYVQADGRPQLAREIGGTAREGLIRLSSALADRTLAAVAVGQPQTIEDPAERARRLSQVLQRMAEAAAATPPAATE